MTGTICNRNLRQDQKVILERLASGPMARRRLAAAVAAHTRFSFSEAIQRMSGWLRELAALGVVWTGRTRGGDGFETDAVALTRYGKAILARVPARAR